MKKIFFALFLFIFLLIPQFEAAAQNTQFPNFFDMTGFPQWARDMRRFDVIAFGTFPFTLFAVTFVTDIFRWNNANGMNFNDLRYAPWPLKSAGAVEMTSYEYGRTILIAAGLSLTLALVDFIIVKIRQSSERRRIESRPSSSVNIYRGPPVNELPSEESGDDGLPDTDETE